MIVEKCLDYGFISFIVGIGNKIHDVTSIGKLTCESPAESNISK